MYYKLSVGKVLKFGKDWYDCALYLMFDMTVTIKKIALYLYWMLSYFVFAMIIINMGYCCEKMAVRVNPSFSTLMGWPLRGFCGDMAPTPWANGLWPNRWKSWGRRQEIVLPFSNKLQGTRWKSMTKSNRTILGLHKSKICIIFTLYKHSITSLNATMYNLHAITIPFI